MCVCVSERERPFSWRERLGARLGSNPPGGIAPHLLSAAHVLSVMRHSIDSSDVLRAEQRGQQVATRQCHTQTWTQDCGRPLTLPHLPLKVTAPEPATTGAQDRHEPAASRETNEPTTPARCWQRTDTGGSTRGRGVRVIGRGRGRGRVRMRVG